MQRKWIWGIAALGVAAGLVVVALLGSWMLERQAMEVERRFQSLRPVVVYSRDLPAGTAIALEHLSKIHLQARVVTPDVVTPARVDEILGKLLRHPVSRGDLVLRSSVEPTSGGWGQSPQ
jgi:Flp pilus assembly protein CpaB